eukprot:7214772-Heterocapsa_arctica.AAC.1
MSRWRMRPRPRRRVLFAALVESVRSRSTGFRRISVRMLTTRLPSIAPAFKARSSASQDDCAMTLCVRLQVASTRP